MRRFLVGLALALTAATLAPGIAAAQGFGVYEQSACVMGRAGTGVASPCRDASSIYFNPANLARTPSTISVGGTLIAPRGGFTNALTGIQGDMEKKFYPVPNVYINKNVRNRFAVGVGLFAPFGLTTDWPSTFEGRFLGEKTVVRAVYIQPTAAVNLLNGRVALGAGFDVNLSHVELRRRVDLSTQFAAPGVTFGNLGIATGTDFAEADLNANGTGYGFHLGASVQLTPELQFGARYMSRQKVTFDNGNVAFTQVPTGLKLAGSSPFLMPNGTPMPAGTPIDGLVASQFTTGALTPQGATAAIRFPDQLVLGLAAQAAPKVKLLADAQLTYWRVFDAVPITFEKLPPQTLVEDNRPAWTFRFGGEYAFSERTTGRLGIYTHRAASPDYAVTPNLPEGYRTSFTAGFGTHLGESLLLDLAYQYIDQSDRQGRTVDSGSVPPTAALNNGIYRFHAHLFGATFSYAF